MVNNDRNIFCRCAYKQRQYSLYLVSSIFLQKYPDLFLYIWLLVKIFDKHFCIVVSCWVHMEKDNVLTHTETPGQRVLDVLMDDARDTGQEGQSRWGSMEQRDNRVSEAR